MAIEDDKNHEHQLTRSKRKQVPDLMPEIITEIISRLPVKFLLQFRSVSKSWRSIISDPKFAKTHLAHSKNNELSHSIIIYKPNVHNPAFTSFHLTPVLNGCSDNSMGLELDNPLKHINPSPSDRIVGSINGVICVVIDKQVSLWNPSTRISIVLPDSGIKKTLGNPLIYALGCDESTNDYKVIVSICHIFTVVKTNFYSSDVMVYSSRTGFWKRIVDFPSGICLIGGSKFVKGSIHWFAMRRRVSNYPAHEIVSLDSATEIFGEVAQPNYGEGKPVLTLGVLGECLCVQSYFREIGTVDVWMMKEYGVRESWTKLITIPFDGLSKCPAPLYLLKNGEILFVYESTLLLVDPQRKAFRKTGIQYTHGGFEVNTYFESLVSPLIQEGV